MSPKLLLVVIVSTNWIPMSVETPTGHGTTTQVEKEIGIVISNRYAQVIADDKTNTMLLSSQPLLPPSLLIRDKETRWITNEFKIPFSPRWIITNGVYQFNNRIETP